MKFLEKWLHFYRTYTLSYSIRRVNPDELEIRHLILDAFPRGMIRLIFLAILGVIAFIDLQYGVSPFDNQIKAIKYDFEWAFEPDKFILPLYQDHVELHNDPVFTGRYPNSKVMKYEDYRLLYVEDDNWRLIRPIFHVIWPLLLLCILFPPRPRGIRINRKKKVIYQQHLGKEYWLAFIPEEGDPLSGIVYSLDGLYPFSLTGRYSLQIGIPDKAGKLPFLMYGCYPNPSLEHNRYLLRAIRDFVRENNPESLKYIGRCYKLPWLNPLIFLFNVGSIFRMPFNQKLADKQIETELKAWKKRNENSKKHWFDAVQCQQQSVNQQLAELKMDNKI
ncbi:hypothetical protein BKG91_07535 [Rodentibacter caecimuris]|uniref:Uncharacterized protein n=2 Tax=Rodentibacter caecimuris TaxID=1796644 RepID=A0AAJ3K6G5_9PAST|nr:hypothetical protein [Rodentibacter heylii]AOF54411.1 hypothetical protein AC062_2325 [Pasteurellaceae bacterium NI1060]OOF73031.1 hypothetical protein BKG90_02295 [Rodentibacter heylii]OOF74060.1 hypothetical protein BKG91_07535 [Rodentibacter heylii]OOF75692.1 hypothetical protein BKG99_07705 [Rodentibacter heylii]